jgi:antibiotic biosynthesis monooxygenase (ABM) superfamily enzyme
VIVQRFASLDAARDWLGSEDRRRLVDQAQPWLVGQDDIHVVEDGAAPRASSPVSAVISERVAPGQEDAYRAWQRRIAAAQARFPGFEGYKLVPPVPGVQDDWVTILRFDSEAHLDAWLRSPERRQLIAEATAFAGETHARTVRTGFDAWFKVGTEAGPLPPAWKQNMLVLLTLYPVVFLFGKWVQTPLLMERLAMPFWLALFVANLASVLLLAHLVPRVRLLFGWWLNPTGSEARRLDRIGAGLVVVVYAACLLVFSLYR